MSTSMQAGTMSFRFVTLVTLATFGWSLWVTCTDGMAHGGMAADMAVGAFQDQPSSVMDLMDPAVMSAADCLMGDPDCCTMTKPFLALEKSAAPRPDLAATAVPDFCLLALERSDFHDSCGTNGESPPGRTGAIYLTISILRI